MQKSPALLAVSIGLIAAALLGGPGSGCGENRAVKTSRQVADAICACKDQECAFKAAAEGAKQLEKVRTVKGDDAVAKAIEAQGNRARVCMDRIIGEKK